MRHLKKDIFNSLILLFILVLLEISINVKAEDGLPGYPDKVPGASLIVPFFEVGVDANAHPEDTLLVVSNISTDNCTIHYHVWTIDGESTQLYGNFELSSNSSISFSVRAWINSSTEDVQNKLQVTDSYWRGFITFDLVTTETNDPPIATGFPFENKNNLVGYIYYTRLTEGSSIGLNMISLEYLNTTLDFRINDFYDNNDGREEINADARKCAKNMIYGVACETDSTMDRIYARLFLSPTLDVKTRFILFSWNPGYLGGPSKYCELNGCNSRYSFKIYDDNGTVLSSYKLRFDHVVNVVELTGTHGARIELEGLVERGAFQSYAFSINSANADQNSLGFKASWDAIFEANMIP